MEDQAKVKYKYDKFKKCVKCGNDKPLTEDNFGHHAKTKDGWSHTCLECRSLVMRKRNNNTLSGVRRKNIKELRNDKSVIELDFTKRPDLYEEICKIAEDHLREPENQLMWWIINADFDKLQKGLAGE